MTTPKKKATRKRKPKINEEQLEMARLYEKAWHKLFESIPKSIQKDIIEKALKQGFLLDGKIDMTPVQYENQYLYILHCSK